MTRIGWWIAGAMLVSPGCIAVLVQCECRSHAEHAEHHADAGNTPAPAAPSFDADPVPAPARPPSRPPEFDAPPRQSLADIPRNEALANVGRSTAAAFEVDGDRLVGVWHNDEVAAEGALALWQELILRIPTNQRADLVQFEITRQSDPVASTDNSGTGGSTGRFGTVLSFSRNNFKRNQPDVTAPLARHRGTFDWTLIHEFGHMRMYADGRVNDFVETFGGPKGSGEGYPDDGSPSLVGDWVTSYAERAGGDEDCAESFTTYVMLDELPHGESLAAQKVRWFATIPGYPELRRALRLTEPDGSTAELEPAPRRTYPLVVEPPNWLRGTWKGQLSDGSPITYEITAEDIVRIRTVEGGEIERWSYRDLRDRDPLATVDLYESNDDFYLHQVSLGGRSFSESFRRKAGQLVVDNERLGDFDIIRAE